MKNYRLASQCNTYSGPDMKGVTRAKKELAAVVRSEKQLARQAGYTPKVHWSSDRLDCTITLGPDEQYSPLWNRFAMNEVYPVKV